jgi:hypothetical protein
MRRKNIIEAAMEILMSIFIVLFVIHGIHVERKLDRIATLLHKTERIKT